MSQLPLSQLPLSQLPVKMADERKLILVSNDDGVRSPGIVALAEAMKALGDVWIVAPDREQSAAGHSISLGKPLRMETLSDRVVAVDGTPTDCVYMGLHHVLPRLPDLLVSGINWGGNLGNDVTYSGTVSAAMEGTVFGVPSIAFSQLRPREADFARAAAFAVTVARWVLAKGLPRDTLLSVNFPPHMDPEKYMWAHLGKRNYGKLVDVRTDPRGRNYYWIGGDDIGADDRPGSDCNGVAEGWITISPVHMDLTNYDSLAQLKAQRLEDVT